MLEADAAKGHEDAADRLQNLGQLVNNVKNYCDQHGEEASLEGYLEDIALISDIDSYNESADQVVLMTIHSAKGLEFPYVFLIGMEEGVFPSEMSKYSEADLEEERRLAYVGITRAKQELYISNSVTRMLYGRTQRNEPSRFLREIEPEYIEETRSPALEQRSSSGRLGQPLQRHRARRRVGLLRRFRLGPRHIHYRRLRRQHGLRQSIRLPEPGVQRRGAQLRLWQQLCGPGQRHHGIWRAGQRLRRLPPGRRRLWQRLWPPRRPQSARKAHPVCRGARRASSSAGGSKHYEPGDVVEHKVFGRGTVVAVKPAAGDQIVEIRFEKVGVKKTMANFAPLTKITEE